MIRASGAAAANHWIQVNRFCAGSGMRLQARRQTGEPFRNRKMNGPEPIHAERPRMALAGLRSRSRSASATPTASGALTAARAIASGSSGVRRMPVPRKAADCQATRGGTRSTSSSPIRRSRPDRDTAAAIPSTPRTKTQLSEAKPVSVA